MARPAPLAASAPDLPPGVAAALEAPTPGRPIAVRAGSIDFTALEWAPGPATPGAATPGPAGGVDTVLLLHGITNSARGWWLIAPALAASGRRVIALDAPGHGTTRGWEGGAAFGETARSIAAFARAAGLDADADRRLGVVGHSWGAMVAAELPGAGLAPARIVLLDAPHLTDAGIGEIVRGAAAERSAPPGELEALLRAAYPEWRAEDIRVKAEQIGQYAPERVLAVGLENRWDGGLAAIRAASATGYPATRYRIVRGVPALGGLLPDEVLPSFAALIGDAGIVTLVGAPHSPQRTHPEALLLALLRAFA